MISDACLWNVWLRRMPADNDVCMRYICGARGAVCAVGRELCVLNLNAAKEPERLSTTAQLCWPHVRCEL